MLGFSLNGNRDIVYEKILRERSTWQEQDCPVLIPEDSLSLTSYPMFAQPVQKWMEDAKRIDVAGYRQALEDGPDVCDSESEAGYSIDGEVLKWMYTSELLGKDGKPDLASARMTTEQANMQRAMAKAQAREKLLAVSTSRSPTCGFPTRMFVRLLIVHDSAHSVPNPYQLSR
jgi:hypothetical protein